jgi:hypothetical protein
MRAIFGVVSLLVVVAIVGLLATRQLKAVNSSLSTAAQALPAGASAPPAAASGSTVREQSQQLQQRVANDVSKALEQGARKEESEK